MTNINLIQIFSFTFAKIALIATILITLICGFLSPIVVLKQRSYIADALSHLVFPGVVIGILTAETTNLPLWLCVLIGSIITALIGTFLSEWLLKILKIPPDSSAIICLTVFFAFGIIAISLHRGVRISPDSILFGDILTLSWGYIALLSIVLFVTVFSLVLLNKHWNSWLADHEFAIIMGYKAQLLDKLFPLLVTFAVLAGIFAVGGLMISALVTIPTILYQPRSALSPITILASVVTGLIGVFISFLLNLPVGATIVIVGFIVLLIKCVAVKLRTV